MAEAQKGGATQANAASAGYGCLLVIGIALFCLFASCIMSAHEEDRKIKSERLAQQASPDKPTAVRFAVESVMGSKDAFAAYADGPDGEAIVRVKLDTVGIIFAWGNISRLMSELVRLPALRDAKSFILDLYIEKQDTLGNRDWHRAVALGMTREQAQQVQWENISGEDQVRALYARYGTITPGR